LQQSPFGGGIQGQLAPQTLLSGQGGYGGQGAWGGRAW
jgi:hypothetical protein